MSSLVILSYVQAERLLTARAQGASSVEVSPDLGLSTVTVALTEEGARFPSGEFLAWDVVDQIRRAETSCFVIEGDAARKVQAFSEATGRFYSLMSTQGAPTLLVSGITMHRVKGTEPYADTLAKIRAISPITGRVLDTATGLGYTAIEAAKVAERVVTIELDPAVLEIARVNPWSRALFEHPGIEQLVGDSFELVQEFEVASFSCVIHDPPMLSLAGDLYSGAFYRQLFRVLRPRGRLFHYIGDLDSRSGRNIARGVMRRLQEAGFRRVVRRPKAFGLVAYK
ncbi:MAG: methyltransferase domain-containing protein [Anaerolineae bacterium]|nr:methyltransferase domain-containing protein [Anaerolineae bacterium]